jgi:hypothetical protein
VRRLERVERQAFVGATGDVRYNAPESGSLIGTVDSYLTRANRTACLANPPEFVPQRPFQPVGIGFCFAASRVGTPRSSPPRKWLRTPCLPYVAGNHGLAIWQNIGVFRAKRSDTKVGTIEARYGIDLHARSDMLLSNLLEERGFDSLSQLVRAFRCQLTIHARKRRLFLSFHSEDKRQVGDFRALATDPEVDIDFYDDGLREPINSERGPYVKSLIRGKIDRASVVVCLIGNGTAWREWVDWELSYALQRHKGICGVRLDGARGRRPELLFEIGSPIARWDHDDIIAVIECAAARRS